MPKMPKQLDDLQAAKKQIDVREYNRLLKQVQLETILLRDSHSKLRTRKMEANNTYRYEESSEVLSVGDRRATLRVDSKVVAKSGRRNVAEVKARFEVEFTYEAEVPREFFVIYCYASLPLQTFPYFRQMVDHQFTAMSLPRLVLPLRKFLVGPRKQQ